MTLFDRIVCVPKCCIDVRWDDKCYPCQKCILAWQAYHNLNDYDEFTNEQLDSWVRNAVSEIPEGESMAEHMPEFLRQEALERQRVGAVIAHIQNVHGYRDYREGQQWAF